MAGHNKTGKQGEELAKLFFEEKGYTILHCNWRYSHYEIDIIAYKKDKLHFIEVKARTNTKFGHPEEAVTRKKMGSLMKAAEAYQHQNPYWKKIQFDVLSVMITKNNLPDFYLIEDVYLYD